MRELRSFAGQDMLLWNFVKVYFERINQAHMLRINMMGDKEETGKPVGYMHMQLLSWQWSLRCRVVCSGYILKTIQ